MGGRRREPVGTDRHVAERWQSRRHDVDEAHRRGQCRVRHLQEPGLAEVQRGLSGPDRGAQTAVGLLATAMAERTIDLLLAGIDQHDVDAAGGGAVETEVEAGWHLVTDLPVRCRQGGDRPVEHGQTGGPPDGMHGNPYGDLLFLGGGPGRLPGHRELGVGRRRSGRRGGTGGRLASLQQPGLVAGPGAAGQHEQGESEAERHGAHALMVGLPRSDGLIPEYGDQPIR